MVLAVHVVFCLFLFCCATEEFHLDDKEIHDRDMAWLHKSDGETHTVCRLQADKHADL